MHQADLQWPAANPNRAHPIAPSGHEQGSSGRTFLATDGVPKLHPSGSKSWPTDPAFHGAQSTGSDPSRICPAIHSSIGSSVSADPHPPSIEQLGRVDIPLHQRP
ncbi:hypothetical protein ACLOJK_004788 [Asimina triloba]